MTLPVLADTFWTEKRLPINQPQKLGIPRKYDAIRKWIMEGLTSRVTGEVVRLEGCYEGQELCTTKEAYDRFLKKFNGLPEDE